MRKARLKPLLLLGTFCALASSCRTPGPHLEVCVSEPSSFGMYCATKDDPPVQVFRHYLDTAGFTCLSPDDFRVLSEWIERHARGRNR
jgi:hypothetical protein